MSSLSGIRVEPFPLLLEMSEGTDQQAQQPDSDEDVMARIQNGDHDALKLLFDRYSKLVFCVVVRVLHDVGEAEDVVQEVFSNLYQKAFLFDSNKGTAKSWILRAAFRRALDRHSYLKKRHFYPGENLALVGDLLCEAVDLERQIVARLSLEQLQHLQNELSEEQRQTLQLFFFEGMTFQEIAEKLREPLGNVRHYYYRGLERLRKGVFSKS
jgi:RNA polymerase sigma-70 factor (ECF subfamily)